MRYLELLLLSLYVAAPIVNAAPLPTMETLKPVRQTLNAATEAIQGATKGISTNMAGGMAGMAEAALPAERVPGGGFPVVAKRQSDGPIGLNLVGLLNTKKPGLGAPETLAPAMDLLKTLKDPESALKMVPTEGLVKRILGGLGGLLGPLQSLTSMANPSPPPAKAPPPVADPKKGGKKPAPPQPKEGNMGPEAAAKPSNAPGEARSKVAPGSVGTDTITGSPDGGEEGPASAGSADREELPIPGFPTAGKTNSDISTDTNIPPPPPPTTKTTVWNAPREATMGNNEVFKRFVDLLESIPARKLKREEEGHAEATKVEKRLLPAGLDPLGQITGRLDSLTKTIEGANTLAGGLGGGLGPLKKGGKA